MDAGLFLIIVIGILAGLYVFDKILDYVQYRKPKHMKKSDFFDEDDRI